MSSRIASRSAASIVEMLTCSLNGMNQPRSLFGQALCENDLNDCRDRLLACPVTLQLASEGDPADWLSTGLNNALQSRSMSFDRCAPDGIDDRIDFVALAQCIQRSKRHADLGPKRAKNKLATSRCANSGNEIDVFPRIDRGPIDWRIIAQERCEFRDGRPNLARRYVHG